MHEYEEVEVTGEAFRIRKERSLLQEGLLEKISQKDGALGAHDILRIEFEIYDRQTKKWRALTNSDLDKIPVRKGQKLNEKIIEVRKAERDFQQPQPKKRKDGSGSSKTS